MNRKKSICQKLGMRYYECPLMPVIDVECKDCHRNATCCLYRCNKELWKKCCGKRTNREKIDAFFCCLFDYGACPADN